MLDLPELFAPKNKVMGAMRMGPVSFQNFVFVIFSASLFPQSRVTAWSHHMSIFFKYFVGCFLQRQWWYRSRVSVSCKSWIDSIKVAACRSRPTIKDLSVAPSKCVIEACPSIQRKKVCLLAARTHNQRDRPTFFYFDPLCPKCTSREKLPTQLIRVN